MPKFILYPYEFTTDEPIRRKILVFVDVENFNFFTNITSIFDITLAIAINKECPPSTVSGMIEKYRSSYRRGADLFYNITKSRTAWPSTIDKDNWGEEGDDILYIFWKSEYLHEYENVFPCAHNYENNNLKDVSITQSGENFVIEF